VHDAVVERFGSVDEHRLRRVADRDVPSDRRHVRSRRGVPTVGETRSPASGCAESFVHADEFTGRGNTSQGHRVPIVSSIPTALTEQ
jgi:hypothetical protein